MSDHDASASAPPPDHPSLSPHRVRELAVLAKVHPTTLTRFLRGEPVRSTVHARIAEALLHFPVG